MKNIITTIICLLLVQCMYAQEPMVVHTNNVIGCYWSYDMNDWANCTGMPFDRRWKIYPTQIQTIDEGGKFIYYIEKWTIINEKDLVEKYIVTGAKRGNRVEIWFNWGLKEIVTYWKSPNGVKEKHHFRMTNWYIDD